MMPARGSACTRCCSTYGATRRFGGRAAALPLLRAHITQQRRTGSQLLQLQVEQPRAASSRHQRLEQHQQQLLRPQHAEQHPCDPALQGAAGGRHTRRAGRARLPRGHGHRRRQVALLPSAAARQRCASCLLQPARAHRAGCALCMLPCARASSAQAASCNHADRWQHPHCMRAGRITVVVSPLIALMDDQVAALTAKTVKAAMLGSAQASAEVRRGAAEQDVVHTSRAARWCTQQRAGACSSSTCNRQQPCSGAGNLACAPCACARRSSAAHGRASLTCSTSRPSSQSTAARRCSSCMRRGRVGSSRSTRCAALHAMHAAAAMQAAAERL